MKKLLLFLSFVAATALAADAPKPPVAKRVPKESTIHGITRVDDYAWIREKSNPEVIAYLNAENDYANAMMASSAPLQKRLYDEMLSHIKQTDVQVPYRERGWFWYSRTEAGKQYPIYARRRSLDGAEEVTLDLNKLAEGQKFMGLGAYVPSDDANLLAYSTDNTGYRQYTLKVRDLRSGQDVETIAEKVGSVLWAADNKTVFYTVENPAKRQWRLYRHTLGAGKDDPLVYEEPDEMFDLDASRTRSGDWIFVHSDSKTTTEERVIPANDPSAAPRLIVARKEGHKYYGDHRGDRFYFVTNDAGANYRVVSAPVADPQQKNWAEVIAYRKPVRVEDIDVFANHLVVHEREGGLSQLEVLDLRNGKSHRISFPEPAYALFGAANREFDTNVVRYTYSSLVTPSSVYDYDMDARTSKLLKQTEVPGYDKSKYVSERIYATAPDGTKIPISLVRRRDVAAHAQGPMWLTAYGSSTNPTFSATRLVLLDRGVTYAIAHIRGGGEMGKEWHEAGRMMTKKNTFTDFVAAAEQMVKEKYTTPSKLIISGGSAGGLLMGAVTNMRPDLFKAVLAYVPFVDVINTMLDATLPLTTQEYIEWGNPNEKPAYLYMASYDPYMNVTKKKYPSMLVRTSLNDSQVGYWEGVKWVAKLRANNTSSNPILLRVNMGAGHGGASGRYDALKDTAADYAFMLQQWGIREPGA